MDELRQILARELSPAVEILRLLDRGRTSSVWLARESALKRFVAVKVLAAELVQDEVARRRFEREATAAAALRHPDVVPVYRFGYLPQGLPYLVMQYVSGRTLEDRLAAEGPCPWMERAEPLQWWRTSWPQPTGMVSYVATSAPPTSATIPKPAGPWLPISGLPACSPAASRRGPG